MEDTEVRRCARLKSKSAEIKLSMKYEPLLNIPVLHVHLPYEIHRLLRIFDVLICYLVFQVSQINAKAGPVMKQLIDTIRSFGLSFHVWWKPPGKDNLGFDCISFREKDRKKLLVQLPPLLDPLFPPMQLVSCGR